MMRNVKLIVRRRVVVALRVASKTQDDVNDLIDISFYFHWHKNHRKWRVSYRKGAQRWRREQTKKYEESKEGKLETRPIRSFIDFAWKLHNYFWCHQLSTLKAKRRKVKLKLCWRRKVPTDFFSSSFSFLQDFCDEYRHRWMGIENETPVRQMEKKTTTKNPFCYILLVFVNNLRHSSKTFATKIFPFLFTAHWVFRLQLSIFYWFVFSETFIRLNPARFEFEDWKLIQEIVHQVSQLHAHAVRELPRPKPNKYIWL